MSDHLLDRRPSTMLAALHLLGVELGYVYVGAPCQPCGSLADLFAELMTQDTS
jgi:hypothetical protein